MQINLCLRLPHNLFLFLYPYRKIRFHQLKHSTETNKFRKVIKYYASDDNDYLFIKYILI